MKLVTKWVSTGSTFFLHVWCKLKGLNDKNKDTPATLINVLIQNINHRKNHHATTDRITEWLRLKGSLKIILINPSAQAGTPRAISPGPCLVGF